MSSVLEALHCLQAIENQLLEVRRERDNRVQRLEHQRRLLKLSEDKLQEAEVLMRQRQIRLDLLQLEASSREESINRHRQALNRAKTNKEYAAILTAMNTEKADNSKFETEIFQLMDDSQKLTDQIESLRDERGRFLEEASRAEEALRDFDASSQGNSSHLQSQRDVLSAKVDPGILATFNRVADHHEGEALVPVIKLHPKRDEYVCSGCNLKITLELVNALCSRHELQTCTACGRILYLEVPAQTVLRRVSK